jgi:predicted TIM-barrel fold metal-dependent hydrolase
MVSPVGNAAIRDRLQTALRAALRARDKTAASALRSALAAIDNASAVPAAPAPGVASAPHFAGLGAGKAPRRGLAAAAGRILLGSDFPNIPYPYLDQLEALARLDFGAAWLRAVCHDNAVRLLGL